MATIVSDKLINAAFESDCSQAEEEAIQFLCNVHMPVINIPSLRDLTLSNFKRRMVKCDGKVRETDIVLVATTDFVASALACPTLFHWNLEEHSEQVVALLQDLGRRWTRLMTLDEGRRAPLAALLETSVMRLSGHQFKHFEEALLVARQPARTPAAFTPQVEGFEKMLHSFFPEDRGSQKKSPAVPDLRRAWRPAIAAVPQGKRPRKTLLSFFSKAEGTGVKSGSKVETGGSLKHEGDDLSSPIVEWMGKTPPVDLLGDNKMADSPHQTKPQEYANSQAKLLANPPLQSILLSNPLNHSASNLKAVNHSVPVLNTANQGRQLVFASSQGKLLVNISHHSLPPSNAANQDKLLLNATNHGVLPLVNATNQDKPLLNVTNHGKPMLNALQLMMNAAKENQRKHAATNSSPQGKEKLARKAVW